MSPTVADFPSLADDEDFLATLMGCERGKGAAITFGLELGLLVGDTSTLRCDACN